MSSNERSRRRFLEGSLTLGVLRFGAPLAIGMALHTAFNFVDLYMISRLEDASSALAALGVCDMLAALATIVSNGVATATVTLLATSLGRRDTREVRRVTWQSMNVVAALSIGFGAIGLFGSDTLVRDVIGAKGAAADAAVPYLKILLGGCFSIFFLLQLTAILRALGHAKTAAALLVGGNLLNLLLNAVMIYGPGPTPELFAWGQPIAVALGVPRMGIEGAAWATLIARTVPVLLALVLVMRRRGGPRFHPMYLRPFRRELRQLWQLAWPASAQLVLRVGAVLFVLALVSHAYTTESDQSVLTAVGVCSRLETMVIFVGMGWGAAAASFVGTSLGAGNVVRARRAGLVAAAWTLVSTGAFVVAYYVHRQSVLAFFDPTPAVVAAGVGYVEGVAWSYAFFGVGVVLSQAMAGAGATFESLVLDAFLVLALVSPAAWIAVVGTGAPKEVLWHVLALGNALGMFVYGAWYLRGRFFGAASVAPAAAKP